MTTRSTILIVLGGYLITAAALLGHSVLVGAPPFA